MLHMFGAKRRAAGGAFPAPEGIKAVVFDLDGTLCDSLADIKAACDAALWTLERREPFTLQNYALFAGNGDRMLLARVLAAADARARGDMVRPARRRLWKSAPRRRPLRVS
jgi:phosphoglycolate phosphatase-like HAD superfamily hydrolase